MKTSVFKRALSCLLCLMMVCSIGAALPVSAEELDISLEQLIANDYVLYFANCGAGQTATVADGDKMGLLQSRTDQAFGADPVTGRQWGYRNVSPHSITSASNDATNVKTTSRRYMSTSSSYVSGTSGIRYDFELPVGSYNVTLGFQNPWNTRGVDISLEGGYVTTSQLSITQNALVTRNYDVSVSDGTLNVFVANLTTRTSTSYDPLVSYIIVKALPVYTKETLAAKIALCTLPSDGRGGYTTGSLLVYDNAFAAAELLMAQQETTEAAIKTAMENLSSAYDNLRKLAIESGKRWVDTNGVLIQAHGGQIQTFTVNGETKYYWYGEDKTSNSGAARHGVHVYSSTDLYNWTDEGLALRVIPNREALDTDPYFSSVYQGDSEAQKDNTYYWIREGLVLERPKVLYNDITGKYVMWFHADGPLTQGGSSYARAAAGCAISDSPVGPFKFLNASRLNVCPPDQTDQWPSDKGFSRDMTLFKDEDGTGYIIYSSEENLTLYISKLNEEYTFLSAPVDSAVYGEDFIRLFPGAQREAPALFHYNGTYYLVTSGATGWAPNRARYYTADSVMGNWVNRGDPCIGTGADTTFSSQSTHVFPVDAENGKFMYMGDRWVSSALGTSSYVWLPVEFPADGTMALRWKDEWKIEEMKSYAPMQILTPLPTLRYLGESVTLPTQLEIVFGEEEAITLPVTWSTNVNQSTTPGVITVNGVIDGYREYSYTMAVMPRNTLYFANPGTSDGVSGDYKKMTSEVSGSLLHTLPDQPYNAEQSPRAWGYSQRTGTSVSNSSSDIFSGLRYSTAATSGSNRDFSYLFDLPQGSYTVYVGFYDPWAQWANGNRLVKTSINGSTVESSRNIDGSYRVATFSNITMAEGGTMDVNFAPVNTGDNSNIQVSWVMVARSEPLADFTELQTLYDANLGREEGNFTPVSWRAFQDAMEEARLVLGRLDSSQQQVEDALSALRQAAEGLVSFGILSVSLDKEEVLVNQPLLVTVVASDPLIKISLRNEKDASLGAALVSRSRNGDGTTTWVYRTAIGSPGESRQITVKADVDRSSVFPYSAPPVTVKVSRDVAIVDASLTAISSGSTDIALVNEELRLTVVTGPDATVIALYNETGGRIGIALENKALNETGKMVWTLLVKVGTAGDRVLTVQSLSGTQSDSRHLHITLLRFFPSAALLSATANVAAVEAGQPLRITVTTGNLVSKLGLFNEKGRVLGKTLVSKKMDKNTGIVTWEYEIRMETPGLERKVVVKATEADGGYNEETALSVNVIVV